MPKDDLITFNGTITAEMGSGIFSITLDNGNKVSARLSGKMRHNKILVLVGDKIEVSFSEYDTTHGLITRRFK
jgi:translation initiation factor IF-1